MLSTYIIALASQVPPPPPMPTYYEFPEARHQMRSTHVKCGAKSLQIDMYSDEYSTVKKLVFGRKRFGVRDLAKLNEWLRPIKGSVNVAIMCGYDGADLVFVDALNWAADGRESIEVLLVDGHLKLERTNYSKIRPAAS